MGKPAFPIAVDLAITGRCNLRCKHCNTADTWKTDDELSFDEIVSLLDSLKDEKIFRLNVFGGEPFFYPEIIEFIRLLDKYPFRVAFLTNGTLIDRTIILELKKMRFLETVQVSIDGSSSSVHDWQRGEGSFEKAQRGLKLLIDSALPVKIKAIINSENHTDMENMVKMAAGIGLKGMDFGDAVECGSASVHSSSMRFDGRTHRSIMETMFELKRKYREFFFGGTLAQKTEMLTHFYENGPGKGERGTFSTCPAGQNMLSIRSDGKVVPCSAFWTLICGDLRKESIKNIWENSKVLNDIRALAEVPLTDYGENCGNCDYLSYCNGGCRAGAYYSSGKGTRGIDPANCLVFSGVHGFRVDREKVVLTAKSS